MTLIVDWICMMCTSCFILILIIHIRPSHPIFLPHPHAGHCISYDVFVPHGPHSSPQRLTKNKLSEIWPEYDVMSGVLCHVTKCCGCEQCGHNVKCSSSQCWNYSLSMTFTEPQVITPHENTAMIVLQISLETPTTYILLSFFRSQSEAHDWLETYRSSGCDWLVISHQDPYLVAMSHRAETRPSWPDVGVGLFLNLFLRRPSRYPGGSYGIMAVPGSVGVSEMRWECEIH